MQITNQSIQSLRYLRSIYPTSISWCCRNHVINLLMTALSGPPINYWQNKSAPNSPSIIKLNNDIAIVFGLTQYPFFLVLLTIRIPNNAHLQIIMLVIASTQQVLLPQQVPQLWLNNLPLIIASSWVSLLQLLLRWYKCPI